MHLSNPEMIAVLFRFYIYGLYSALFRCSKIQKYSPSESAKVYEKAVNRKSSVNFNPRQTIDFLQNDEIRDEMTYELKRKIVKQYLDVSCFFVVLFLQIFVKKCYGMLYIYC